MAGLKQTFFAAATAAVTVAGAALPAAAQQNCMTYGKLALQQQKENERKGCNFQGPSWSPDLRAHIRWCGTVGPDQWKTELQKRAKMLSECK